MSSLPYVLADVFTGTPLQGNPLAVFTGGDSVEPELMPRLARELNLSEAVFLLAPQAGGTARVRIFTPAAELPFAGHPVLGTAAWLALENGLDEITLETGRGPVRVELERRSGTVAHGRMAQPVPAWEPYERADELLRALGAPRSELPVELYDNGMRHVYVTLSSSDDVAALRPDMAALAGHPVEVNCLAADGARVHTRMFAPAIGVDEDPATGSAAGPLAVHLARHGRIAWGDEVTIDQGVEMGRPSRLLARAEGEDSAVTRVEVAGDAVIVGRGAFDLP